ncbi:hypothetical protein ACFVHB_01555 [Kitasatospora sp. NPDC127111]|uniref:hypothetical protein n=1 Tax=Kitasatospora sp. NPDC127111 TaxID=3345363 RepID=UPI003636B510
MSKYGRDELEWDELVGAGLDFLRERAGLSDPTTTYTEMNAVLVERTGLPGFDFGQARDRAAMGHLLGLIVDRDFPQSGLMLSALVRYQGENDAGSGFYALAQQLGLLPKGAPVDAKWEFWIRQIKGLQQRHAAPATG